MSATPRSVVRAAAPPALPASVPLAISSVARGASTRPRRASMVAKCCPLAQEPRPQRRRQRPPIAGPRRRPGDSRTSRPAPAARLASPATPGSDCARASDPRAPSSSSRVSCRSSSAAGDGHVHHAPDLALAAAPTASADASNLHDIQPIRLRPPRTADSLQCSTNRPPRCRSPAAHQPPVQPESIAARFVTTPHRRVARQAKARPCAASTSRSSAARSPAGDRPQARSLRRRRRETQRPLRAPQFKGQIQHAPRVRYTRSNGSSSVISSSCVCQSSTVCRSLPRRPFALLSRRDRPPT